MTIQQTRVPSRARVSPTTHPWRRRAIWAGAVLVVLVLVVFTAGSWYFSSLIRTKALEVKPVDDHPNVVVTDVGPDWVALRRTRDMSEELASGHVYGLEWATGYGVVRDLEGTDGASARRAFEVVSGTAPTAGTAARITRDVYPRNPGTLLGFPLQEVSYRSPAGTFAAYLADGTSDTWSVLVHGRGATRSEMFRLMRVTVGMGMPSLDISYRHDPENGGGLARFGETEWPDLEAAVRWTLDHGAQHVVLVGTSMGGAVTAAFLEHSVLATKVSGVVLDAPMLDFDALVRHGAKDSSVPVLGTPIPGPLISGALTLAGLRFGIDRDAVDYLDDTSWVKAPVLVFHGKEDAKSPVSVTQRLARVEPDLVTAVLVPGADHVESWNADPAAYEQRVREFLRPLL